MRKIKYVSRKQQLEGLRCTLQRIPFIIFIRALQNLVACKYISKSRMMVNIKDARHILNISYKEYQQIVRQTYKNTRTPQGGWY